MTTLGLRRKGTSISYLTFLFLVFSFAKSTSNTSLLGQLRGLNKAIGGMVLGTGHTSNEPKKPLAAGSAPSSFLYDLILPLPSTFLPSGHTGLLLVLKLADTSHLRVFALAIPQMSTWPTLSLNNCSCHLFNEACPDHPI